jgi:hypothetical protein
MEVCVAPGSSYAFLAFNQNVITTPPTILLPPFELVMQR